MSNILSEVLLQASQASYTGGASEIPAGYSLDPSFDGDGVLDIPDIGLKVIALKNSDGDVVLAFAGTGNNCSLTPFFLFFILGRRKT